MKRFLLSLFALLLLGCNSTFDSSVPDWPVYLELDLTSIPPQQLIRPPRRRASAVY